MAAIVGSPVLARMLFNYVGPGTFSGILGAGNAGSGIIDGDLLLNVVNPVIAIAVFGVFIKNAIDYWLHSSSWVAKLLLVLAGILAAGICWSIVFSKEVIYLF